MAVTVTIHFQDGFFGEAMELWRGDARLASWALNTRLQTGLAAIERVSLEPGERVRLIVKGSGKAADIDVPRDGGVLAVNLEDGVPKVRFVDEEPGYL
jgi:hypothetical protein